MRKILEALLYSLPVQLVFNHIRKNISLILVWILLIATIFGGVGRIYGVHFLFLDPEYMNEVGFWSFFLVGMAFGNLTMAFHITSYILDSHQFTFIGILERPFAKFTLNNSIIPLIALVIYLVAIVHFQLNNEFTTISKLILEVTGFLLGVMIICVFFFAYFRFTNKDIFKYLAGSVDKRLRKSAISRDRMMKKYKESKEKKKLVTSYLDLKFRPRSCTDILDFQDKDALLKVFDQNHFNSVIIELAFIIVIILLGSFMEVPYFQIPAAASAIIMFSILVMLAGAVSFWFKGWGISFVIFIFILVNILVKTGVIKGTYHARGLDYSVPPTEYSIERIQRLNTWDQYEEDKHHTYSILENWKSKQGVEKPKMILQCISGGGQRAALWAVNSLQKADSILEGELMKRSVLITGASGGLIGSAYYREMVYRKKLGEDVDPSSIQLLDNIGKDNLNPIIFSLLVNDAFSRVRSYEYEGHSYKLDRGYVFERNLNKNLNGVLDKKLSAYRTPERNAEIPIMMMSPVIANDGRKLVISAQPASFFNIQGDKNDSVPFKMGGVDFNDLFKNHGSEDLNFISALRMSASFPYITPTISLPSDPAIEIMDAGISDNYGVSDALQFLHVFKDWINQNTSGVVLLIIRDTRKIAPVERRSNPSLIERLTYPIASVYNNLGNIQDINNDSKIASIMMILKQPLEVVELEYDTYSIFDDEAFANEAREVQAKEMERASLSWHLTTREKKNIIENINRPNNREALKKLQLIMSDSL